MEKKDEKKAKNTDLTFKFSGLLRIMPTQCVFK